MSSQDEHFDELQQLAARHFEGGLEDTYPATLVDWLRTEELFGANIPEEFGGLGLPPAEISEVTRNVAKCCQPLAGLLGTHLRACLYLLRVGTTEQKAEWLPRMATGEVVFAHAYNELNRKDFGSFQVTVTNGRLNGTKDWSTNARHADHMIVIARADQGLRAVILPTDRPGIEVGNDLPRPGMLGVSLTPVTFNNVEVDPARDFVGGPDIDVTQFILDNERGSSLAFAARAVGAAEAVFDASVGHVSTTVLSRSAVASGAIALRVGELAAEVHALRSAWRTAVAGGDPDEAHLAKVFCTEALQRVVTRSVALVGGPAYAGTSEFWSRHYRDSLALLLIDTPNDVLLHRIGLDRLALRADR